jgi:hypothetical protein
LVADRNELFETSITADSCREQTLPIRTGVSAREPIR